MQSDFHYSFIDSGNKHMHTEKNFTKINKVR